MLYDTREILMVLIGRLPTDSIHRTGRDRVIDIISFIGIECLDTRESVIIEFEYGTRYGSTRTTADTCWVHMRLSEIFELFRGQERHRGKVKGKSE
jgi:hypothetical protein